MFLPGGNEYILVHLQQPSCNWYHTCSMSQSPFKGTDKYVKFFIQY